MKKKVLSTILTFTMVVSALAGCGSAASTPAATTDTQTSADAAPAADNAAPAADTAAAESAPAEELTGIDAIIAEAEGMTMEELAKKAIEESNGKTFYGVGNSSRGKSALPVFIEYLQSIDPSYSMEFEWQQPKNNKIFEQLTSDSLKSEGTFAMTLIQDGNQIQSKMVDTDILRHSFLRSGQRLTEQQLMLMRDSFLFRHLTRYSCTTTREQLHTQTAGTSYMKVHTLFPWALTLRS